MRKLFPEERRAAILDMLAVQSKVLVSDLVKQFGISAFTVRADLDELEAEGKLHRCHGGAMAANKTADVEEYEARAVRHRDEKRAIGAIAAQLVEPGDSVIIDTGTTTVELVRSLASVERLTILTNDLEIAALAEKTIPDAKVFFLGGFIQHGFRYTYGSAVLSALEPFNVDKAFISANAFNVDQGFSSESVEQATIKKEYLKHAREKYLLMDTSKIGLLTLVSFADESDLGALVCERPVEESIAHAMRKKNPSLRFICPQHDSDKVDGRGDADDAPIASR